MICKHILFITFLNEPELILLYSVKWFQVYKSQFNSHLLAHSLYVIHSLNKLELICLHISIAIVSTQLIGFNYCYLTIIILFNTIHSFAHSQMVPSIAMYH